MKKSKGIFYILMILAGIFGIVFFFLYFGVPSLFNIPPENLAVAKRNSYLPLLLFTALSAFVAVNTLTRRKFQSAVIVLLIVLSLFDLLRFFNKFTPFSPVAYLFPGTKTIKFLQKNADNARIMSTDRRILPPNFSAIYKLQSTDVYDPLYLLRYGELIAAVERGNANINPPFGFNRIITPQRYDSKITDLLGVKYILSLTDLNHPKLRLVFREGEARVYENTSAMPRVFFVDNTVQASGKAEAIQKLMDPGTDLTKTAIVEPIPRNDTIRYKLKDISGSRAKGIAVITEYSANRIVIETEVAGKDNEGFLVLTDSFYPTWKVKVFPEGKGSYEAGILRTDFNFRGVFVPEGKSTLIFSNSMFHGG